MILPVTSIAIYKKNPRSKLNPKFFLIKESIKVRKGLSGQLLVTKRPGDNFYTLYMGGKTRLLALQQLWEETKDPAFEYIAVRYVEWQSEVDIISAHLIENEARADNSFWEKANGFLTLKAAIEEEKQQTLSASALSTYLKTLGIDIGVSTIKYYFFTLQSLSPIGPYLRSEDVKILQPKINLAKLIWERSQHYQQGEFTQWLTSQLEHYACIIRKSDYIEASTLLDWLEQQLVTELKTDSNSLKQTLLLLSINPQASIEEIHTCL